MITTSPNERPATRSPTGPAARESALVILLAAACFIPFLGKAFFIDDALFLRNAEQILARPGDFFGGTMNWHGTVERVAEITRNPPAACYFAALAGWATGWREVGMHLFFLLPALATAALTVGLARRAGAPAAAAAALTLATPAFLISGSNVMSDMTMTAFWCGAVYCWQRGHDARGVGWFLVGGLCAAMAFLSKYFGISVVFLLAAFSVMTERRAGRWLWGLTIPLAGVIGYEWLTRRLYGRGLFLESAACAIEHPATRGGLLGEGLIGVEFFGGCLLPALFVVPLFEKRRRLAVFAVGLTATAVLALAGGFAFGGAASPGNVQAIHWLVFFIAGGLLLALPAAAAAGRKDPFAVVLCLWIWGVFIFTTFCNWTISGRNTLAAAPAVGLLVAGELRRDVKPRRLALAAALALAFSLFVAQGDFAVANAQRELARATHRRYGAYGANLTFMGHWGWQRYLEQDGHTPITIDRFVFTPEQIAVIPFNNTNAAPLPAVRFRLIDTLRVPVASWATTMSTVRRVGFYSTTFGSLPYALMKPPDEQAAVFVLKTAEP